MKNVFGHNTKALSTGEVMHDMGSPSLIMNRSYIGDMSVLLAMYSSCILLYILMPVIRRMMAVMIISTGILPPNMILRAIIPFKTLELISGFSC